MLKGAIRMSWHFSRISPHDQSNVDSGSAGRQAPHFEVALPAPHSRPAVVILSSFKQGNLGCTFCYDTPNHCSNNTNYSSY